jgi:hypothetical protein
MVFRAGPHVLASYVVAATLALATGCNDDDDDGCVSCCKCSNDGAPLVYRPDAPGDCSTCQEQCQALADREFLGQEFDHADEIECPE